jgi:para-nitrobenzyl esterase
VLVYIYGGGFRAGDGSEPRYDGENLAAQGLVVVTLNYRLGVFGFFAHPQLTAESPHHASGNYGLLDQAAALAWVKANIAAFGGDPARITIGGESAGSYSVSAQMVSPLSRKLIAGAIGESGSVMTLNATPDLKASEAAGLDFARRSEAADLAALRALPAQQLLDLSTKINPSVFPIVDGWFFPKPPAAIYAAGEAARVPLLVGSNAQENPARVILGDAPPSLAAWRAGVTARYGEKAPAVLAAYPAAADADVTAAAEALASDRFIAWSTWKWFDLHRRTGAATYYYYYAQPRPPEGGRAGSASHSAEIEYALGNLDRNPVYAWTSEDREVSRQFQGWVVNFVKRGDPNGPGLAAWPAAGVTAAPARLVITPKPAAIRFDDARYRALETITAAR